MPDLGWSRQIAKQDEDNYIACITVAKENGFSDENALDCVNGNLNCKNCPFKVVGKEK